MGEPQLTFNYCRALSDFTTNFTFSRGVTFRTPDETEGIVPNRLRRVWEVDNDKEALLWETGQLGSVSGDVFLKVAYEDPWTDPSGRMHPGRVRILPLNPAHCFPEFHPHDRSRMLRFKLKYRFWGTSMEGTRQVFTYCVDDATEILSQQGWKKRWELTTDDKVLGIDPQTDAVTWQPVLAVNEFDWDGPLVRWQNTRFDALTTPNHRWITQDWRARDPRYAHQAKNGWKTTEQLSGGRGSDQILLGGGTPLAFAEVGKYSDEMVQTIGWVMTEGHYRHYGSDTNTVVLSQSAVASALHCSDIRALAAYWKSEGLPWSEYRAPSRPDMVRWFITGEMARWIRHAAPDRQLTPEFLCSLTHPQAVLLYATLMAGDGHVRHDGGNHGDGTESFSQKDQGRIDGFQMLCAMLGRRTNCRKSEHHSGSDTTIYKNRWMTAREVNAREEHYTGKVWCPSTPTKTFLARRNGVTYWTGNTELITDQGIEEFVNDEMIDSRENPLGTIPIVQIVNLPVSGSPWGLSDLNDITTLNRQYNETATEITDIINYHAAPVTVITGAKASQMEKGPKKVWGGLPKDANVFNLELGANLAGPMEFLLLLKRTMHEMSGVPEAALGQLVPISNTSGVALAIQYQSMMQKYQLKKIQYGKGFVKVNELIMLTLALKEPGALMWDPTQDEELKEGQYDQLDPNDPLTYQTTCHWPAPLPIDELVALNEIQLKMGLGLESKRGALRDLGFDFPDEKMAEIAQELIEDAIEQGALDMLKATISMVVMQATGMSPMGPEEGGGGTTSAGGPDTTSAGAPGPGGAPGGGTGQPFGGSPMGPEADKLYQQLVTKAYGTKLAQRRAPETDQGS